VVINPQPLSFKRVNKNNRVVFPAFISQASRFYKNIFTEMQLCNRGYMSLAFLHRETLILL
jgi:hypothetical protein